MLSLASNISATQAVEAKYSASFDGTGDFIDTGHHFSDVFNDSFTISFWAKPTDGHDTQSFFGANDSDADIIRGEIESSGDFKLTFEADGDPGEYQTDNVVFSDGQATSWTHILITATKASSTAVVVYVNGTAVDITAGSNVAEAKHAAFSSAQNLAIGANNEKGTINGHSTGGIDEFAIFNVALDADAAAAIYNGGSPLNLTFNQGNYDNSSALQAYYRMGNGLFDDKANGVVHDQDNPGFQANIWDGTQGDDANWVMFGTNTKSEEAGAVKLTGDGSNSSGGYIHLRDSKDLSEDLVVGKIYLLQFDSKVNSGSSITWKVQKNSGDTYTTSQALTSTSFIPLKLIFVAQSTTSDYFFSSGLGSGEIVHIKNISLTKLNGKPGLTSRTGDVTFSSDTP